MMMLSIYLSIYLSAGGGVVNLAFSRVDSSRQPMQSSVRESGEWRLIDGR